MRQHRSSFLPSSLAETEPPEWGTIPFPSPLSSDNEDKLSSPPVQYDFSSPNIPKFSPKQPEISKGIFKKPQLTKKSSNINTNKNTVEQNLYSNSMISENFLNYENNDSMDDVLNFINSDFSSDIMDILNPQTPILSEASLNTFTPKSFDNSFVAPPVSIFEKEGTWTYFINDRIDFPYEINKKLEESYKEGKREISFLLDSTRFTLFFDTMLIKNESTNIFYDVGRIADKLRYTEVPLNKFNSNQTLQITYPSEWEPQSKICELKGVPYDSIEFLRIKQLVGSSNICSITRIQNQHLWRRYFFERSFVAQKNNGKANEMELFHGTSSTKPLDIYNGEEGFDMRYSKTGRWGIGIYFANTSSYALQFGYNDIETGTKQLLFSRVAIGSAYACLEGNINLKTPPERKSINLNTELSFSKNFYDSVVGVVGNSKIYTVYNNSKAYPSYLISFKVNE